MKRLLFVRHGESEHHTLGLTGGWSDSALTPLGRRQITATGRRLLKLKLPADTPLYSSDLKRALDSAAIVGEALGVTPVALDLLREIDLGAATGLPLAQAEQLNEPEPAQPDLDWRPNPQAETYREMADRLRAALERIEAAGPETAVVVGHGLSGQELLKGWLGLPMQTRVAIRLGPGSLSELAVNRWGERQIEYLNST